MPNATINPNHQRQRGGEAVVGVLWSAAETSGRAAREAH